MLQNEPTTSLLNNQWSSRLIHFVYKWLPNLMSGDEWNQTSSMSNDVHPGPRNNLPQKDSQKKARKSQKCTL